MRQDLKGCNDALERVRPFPFEGVLQLARSIAVGQRDEAEGVALWKCLRQVPELAQNVGQAITEIAADESHLASNALSYHIQMLTNCVTAVLLGCREAGRESFDSDFSSPCWFNNLSMMPVRSMAEAEVLNSVAERSRGTISDENPASAALKQLPFICSLVFELFGSLESEPAADMVDTLRSLCAWLSSFSQAMEEDGWRCGGLLKQVSMVMTIKTVRDHAIQFQKLTGTHPIVIQQGLMQPLESLVNAICSICQDLESGAEFANAAAPGRSQLTREQGIRGAQTAIDDMAFKARYFDGGSEVSITAEALVDVMSETLASVEELMPKSRRSSGSASLADAAKTPEASLPESVQELLALKAMFCGACGASCVPNGYATTIVRSGRNSRYCQRRRVRLGEIRRCRGCRDPGLSCGCCPRSPSSS